VASISEILSREIGKNGKSKTYIADKLDVTEKTVENYMNGKREPKIADLIKLSSLLGFHLDELSEQNVPQGTYEQNTVLSQVQEEPVVNKDGTPAIKNITSENVLEIIKILVKQNEKLIDSNSKMVDSQYKMATTNDNIAQTNKELANKIAKIPIDGVPKETQVSVDAMLMSLRDLLYDVASGVTFETKDDVDKAYNNKFADALKAKEEKGNHADPGKHRKNNDS
jgi:transcriptional regulator with XRE-family HTH domain